MVTAKQGFPERGHDHADCLTQVLSNAETVCQQRGVRLTPQRRRVLEIVAGSHSPLGAYDILEQMDFAGRRSAPITVYRALDFLIEQGLVHRLASLNAFAAYHFGEEGEFSLPLDIPPVPDAATAKLMGLSESVQEIAEDGKLAQGRHIPAPLVDLGLWLRMSF